MVHETVTQTDYRSINVIYYDPDDNEITTYDAILTSSDTAVFSDPRCPGRIEISMIKPTHEADTYEYDGLSVAFNWDGGLSQFADKLRSMNAFDYAAYILAPAYDIPNELPI